MSRRSRGSERIVSIMHANITTWGPQAEGYVAGSGSDILMLSETHFFAAVQDGLCVLGCERSAAARLRMLQFLLADFPLALRLVP